MGLLSDFNSILIDSNFFLIPFQFGVDVVGELRKKFPGKEVFTLGVCYEELKNKEESKADLAIEYIDKQDVEIKETGHQAHADDQILEYTRKNNVAVCTQDKELKKRLKKEDVKVIILRSYSTLEVV